MHRTGRVCPRDVLPAGVPKENRPMDFDSEEERIPLRFGRRTHAVVRTFLSSFLSRCLCRKTPYGTSRRAPIAQPYSFPVFFFFGHPRAGSVCLRDTLSCSQKSPNEDGPMYIRTRADYFFFSMSPFTPKAPPRDSTLEGRPTSTSRPALSFSVCRSVCPRDTLSCSQKSPIRTAQWIFGRGREPIYLFFSINARGPAGFHQSSSPVLFGRQQCLSEGCPARTSAQ